MPVYSEYLAEQVDGYLYRDRTQADGEFDYFLEWARKTGGPVLELACGAGRIMMDLAQRGFETYGIDMSKPMIDRGIKAMAINLPPAVMRRVHFIFADMRCFSFRKKFPLIIIPFTSFWFNLNRDGAWQCLECILKNLAPGGVFLIDDPQADFDSSYQQWWEKAARELGVTYTTELYFKRNEDKKYVSESTSKGVYCPTMLIGRKA